MSVLCRHHQVDWRIAQGEVQSFRIDVPAGMTVTSVNGDQVGTWRFNPGTPVGSHS